MHNFLTNIQTQIKQKGKGEEKRDPVLNIEFLQGLLSSFFETNLCDSFKYFKKWKHQTCDESFRVPTHISPLPKLLVTFRDMVAWILLIYNQLT